MADPRPDAGDLAMTQAELPPGVAAPSPESAERPEARSAGCVDRRRWMSSGSCGGSPTGSAGWPG